MLLAVNIGNTNVQMGLFVNKKLACCIVFPTCKKPANNYYKAIWENLSQFKNIEAVAICSVVTSLTKPLRKLLKKHLKIEPLIVSENLDLGIKLNYKKKELGVDRIANAVAAYHLYKKGCIVVDFGTAITFDVISPGGVHLGGAIAPGLGSSVKALFSNTSLPEINNLEDTNFAIGKNTAKNLKVGILHGFASMVKGLVEEFKKEIKFKPFIILTGGDANKISKISKFPHSINPFLTLDGIRIIYERNSL